MFLHVGKEVAKNLIKGAFPTLVTRLRGHTGRGQGEQAPKEILRYCRGVFEGHLKALDAGDPEAALRDKRVVELGPGDTLATGLLCLAHGARSYVAVDRFAFRLDTEKNSAMYALLLDSLQGSPRRRLEALLRREGGRFRLAPERIQVLREPAESFQLSEPADLLMSQAVLEHVRDLASVFARMGAACRPGGSMVHVVDLSDHGLYPGRPFKFLSFSPGLWTAMHAFRGSPNRERLPRYRQLLAQNRFDLTRLDVRAAASTEELREARPRLHPAFGSIPDEDLGVLSFHFAAQKQAG
ncbi:MAG: hypothetical protein A3G41_02225 [Elusimicrobia bacterium RIFCSPLOWO2_12_FULL_59_9]|nr:MAG: hypothetical protein A3G41_02225 [Elusimicrobia bacterium RIFCSPLOWO2_12_FULL_59_9]